MNVLECYKLRSWALDFGYWSLDLKEGEMYKQLSNRRPASDSWLARAGRGLVALVCIRRAMKS